MATIRPFRGLRYSAALEPLENLVAPPYDVLSADERNAFAGKSAHNIVHLTLPEQNSDDRSKFVKYARSAAKLEEWRRAGALALEQQPAYYRYTQSFSIPGTEEKLKRIALIAAIKVVPYEKGVVLPHEQTFPKHKEDRLRILEATRAHLECIYGLVEDDDGCILQSVLDAPSELAYSVITDDGVAHKVECITDSAACAKITGHIASKKVWIADGHHRYETACSFRAMKGEQPVEIAEDYMLMALSSISDPGLVLLPTHRIVSGISISESDLRNRLSQYFSVADQRNELLMEAIAKLGSDSVCAFGVALPSGTGLVLTANRSELISNFDTGDQSTRLSQLDVSILHRLILEKSLGIEGLEKISYTRDPVEAIESVRDGSSVAFLMNPPSVDDMREIAVNGEKMPQKSTYYYPKILSGLVLMSLNDWTP